tara:strand:+ start:3053 stop:3292 length:240 start_codon:yes stop_codon:yes gene_type:complete
MDSKEKVEKMISLYAFSQAYASAKVASISDMKIQRHDPKGELVQLHYQMVDKSSVDNAHTHSAKMFKAYYAAIIKEHLS